MPAQIIDGNAISQAVRDEVKREVERLAVRPGLGVILADDTPASASYVRGKERACAEAGIFSETLRPPAGLTRRDALIRLGPSPEAWRPRSRPLPVPRLKPYPLDVDRQLAAPTMWRTASPGRGADDRTKRP